MPRFQVSDKISLNRELSRTYHKDSYRLHESAFYAGAELGNNQKEAFLYYVRGIGLPIFSVSRLFYLGKDSQAFKSLNLASFDGVPYRVLSSLEFLLGKGRKSRETTSELVGDLLGVSRELALKITSSPWSRAALTRDVIIPLLPVWQTKAHNLIDLLSSRERLAELFPNEKVISTLEEDKLHPLSALEEFKVPFRLILQEELQSLKEAVGKNGLPENSLEFFSRIAPISAERMRLHHVEPTEKEIRDICQRELRACLEEARGRRILYVSATEEEAFGAEGIPLDRFTNYISAMDEHKIFEGERTLLRTAVPLSMTESARHVIVQREEILPASEENSTADEEEYGFHP